MMTDGIPTAPDGVALTILVVEDEFWIRLWVSDFLRGCGHRMVEASTGEDAIEVLASGNIPFDVVFSDIEMPGAINGVDLGRWIRGHRPEIQVVLTSGAMISGEVAGEFCEHGPLLPKPYQPADVLDRICRALHRRGQQQGATDTAFR
ncbi:response regulator [Inquilinus limosus]|uniref:response regulator n=1 Tax=Inquilinus limosus TaxID=171674 RepID=UPI003F160011